ncbi:FadR/GntR family transcriptional regulator [Streptomyces sp. NPDC088812]|uniref:FadR/GntR family transcriptional regulator n=1 Tax=Streptomyces sp. NPDC088812 TaxID=3365905 RepID=UPI003818B839
MNLEAHAARRAVFVPLESAARVDVVVRRLTNAIELGLLEDGEQLPGELELASLLGVSTVTLREALVTLRARGLVATRRGRGGGSFVTLPTTPATERLHAQLAEWSTEGLRDLGDHWAAVSGAAGRLAAQRTEPEDLAPLERSAAELERARQPSERARVYGRFHVETAAAAQSARLTRSVISLQAEAGALVCLALADDSHTRDVVHRHRAVISALHDGAGDTAGTVLEECVRATVAHLVRIRLRSL